MYRESLEISQFLTVFSKTKTSCVPRPPLWANAGCYHYPCIFYININFLKRFVTHKLRYFGLISLWYFLQNTVTSVSQLSRYRFRQNSFRGAKEQWGAGPLVREWKLIWQWAVQDQALQYWRVEFKTVQLADTALRWSGRGYHVQVCENETVVGDILTLKKIPRVNETWNVAGLILTFRDACQVMVIDQPLCWGWGVKSYFS